MNDTHKKQFIAVVILAVLNLLVANAAGGDGQTLEGHTITARSSEMRSATLRTLFFGIQLISFVIGSLLAAIPYKGRAYVEKWVTVSLGIAVGLQASFFLLGISKLFMLFIR